MQLTHADTYGHALQTRRGRHRRYPATTEHQGFRRGPQPTSSLIQKWAQHVKLRSYRLDIMHTPISASPTIPVKSLLDGSLVNERVIS
jgi:hypothetical protein